MPLIKLQIKPGVSRESTAYGATGSWFDSDKVRWHNGVAQPIGGWSKFTQAVFAGVCRALIGWANLAGTRLLGIGTSKKYYVVTGGSLTDVTPIRRSVTLGANPIATTNTLTSITVSDTNHDASVGDYVTLSGIPGDIGGVPVAELNGEHIVVSVPTTGTWTFASTTAATSTTTGGGAAVVAEYQLSIGSDSTIYGTGWGAGTWGRGTWGSSATLSTLSARLRVWTHATYGEDLIINPRGGSLYYYDSSAGTRATDISTISGAISPPTKVSQVLVSTQRHVVAFGCNADGSTTQDKMLIRWSDNEDYTDWVATRANQAGELRLTHGSEFVCALETRNEILVWTDASLHSMQYVGAPFVYGLNLIGGNTSIASPLAAASYGDAVMWMGLGHFFIYDGRVRQIPCSVESYVFNDLNGSQRDKIFASTNVAWGEITFYYCSADSDEINRYVTYNIQENTWYYGVLARTFWVDRGIFEYPIAASTDGYTYYHEYGHEDGSTNPGSAISSYVESAPLELDDGNNFVFVNRIIPDITFTGSAESSPMATFYLKGRNYPGSDHSSAQGGSVTRTVEVPVEQYTTVKNIRLRARSVILRVESSQAGVAWHLGVPRIEGRVDGTK